MAADTATKQRVTQGARTWTVDDDASLHAHVIELGFRWRAISDLMPGKSEDAVRQRYNRLTGRVSRVDRSKPTLKTPRAFSATDELENALLQPDPLLFTELCKRYGFQAIRNKRRRMRLSKQLPEVDHWKYLLHHRMHLVEVNDVFFPFEATCVEGS